MEAEQTAQEIVKELRGKHGLSLEEIGVKVKESATTVYRWSEGINNPSYAVTKLLSQILNGYESRK